VRDVFVNRAGEARQVGAFRRRFELPSLVHMHHPRGRKALKNVLLAAEYAPMFSA